MKKRMVSLLLMITVMVCMVIPAQIALADGAINLTQISGFSYDIYNGDNTTYGNLFDESLTTVATIYGNSSQGEPRITMNFGKEVLIERIEMSTPVSATGMSASNWKTVEYSVDGETFSPLHYDRVIGDAVNSTVTGVYTFPAIKAKALRIKNKTVQQAYSNATEVKVFGYEDLNASATPWTGSMTILPTFSYEIYNGDSATFANAFDGDTATLATIYGNSSGANHKIQMDFGKEILVTGMKIHTPYGYSHTSAVSMDTYNTVQYSLDGQVWEPLIFNKEVETSGNTAVGTYTIPGKRLRYLKVSNVATTTYNSVYEVEVFGTEDLTANVEWTGNLCALPNVSVTADYGVLGDYKITDIIDGNYAVGNIVLFNFSGAGVNPTPMTVLNVDLGQIAVINQGIEIYTSGTYASYQHVSLDNYNGLSYSIDGINWNDVSFTKAVDDISSAQDGTQMHAEYTFEPIAARYIKISTEKESKSYAGMSELVISGTTNFPAVTTKSSSIGSVAVESPELRFDFNETMDEATLNTSAVTFKANSVTEAVSSVTFDSVNNQLVVKLGALDFETPCELTIGKEVLKTVGGADMLVDAVFSFVTIADPVEVENVMFIDGAGSDISSQLTLNRGDVIAGKANIINETAHQRDYVVVVAVYNNKGQMIDLKANAGKVASTGSTGIPVTTDTITVSEDDCTASVLVWNSWEGMRPFTSNILLPAGN